MPEDRLQKVLAAAGVASRRASETLIAQGRVRVDGRVAVVGQPVDPATAHIEVDGLPVGVGAARAYVALHKPAGVTSTTRDRHAEVTVVDLVPTALVPDGTRLYPVGRLDQDSEGLLLLTNDGTWADHVLHPRFGVEREYAIGLAIALDTLQVAALRAGIRLDEGLAELAAPLRPATGIETRNLEALMDPAADLGLTWYRAVLAQGWKRQLRRMFAAVGAPINRLVRVRIGSVRIDDLRAGRARRLRAPEIKSLGVGIAHAAPSRTGPGRPGPTRNAPAPSGGRGAPPTPKPSGRPKPPTGPTPGFSGPRKPRPPAPPPDDDAGRTSRTVRTSRRGDRLR